MMRGKFFHVKKLDVAQLAAHEDEKTETGVHIVTRLGQAGTGDDDPAIDARADEKFAFVRQKGADGSRFERPDGQPS